MLTASVTQHGAEAHFLRPDGVMRSSITRAIPGFQPVENAQAVALRFTQPHYFATTLSGGSLGAIALPLWQRVRFAVQSAVARKRAIAVMRRAAGMSGMRGLRGSDIPYEAVTSLPNAYGPGSYGVTPAQESMALVAMRIASGLGPNAIMPDVAQSKMEAAMAIAPNYASEPSKLAAQVASYAPPFVASAGFARAMDVFNRLRMWWYG